MIKMGMELPHPGDTVRYDCIEALGLTVAKAAEVLGVTRQSVTELINGKRGISPVMAVRLEKAFGSTAEAWLRLQAQYDLQQIDRDRITVNPAAVAAPTRVVNGLAARKLPMAASAKATKAATNKPAKVATPKSAQVSATKASATKSAKVATTKAAGKGLVRKTVRSKTRATHPRKRTA